MYRRENAEQWRGARARRRPDLRAGRPFEAVGSGDGARDAADRDLDLNRAAPELLAAALAMGDLRDADGRPLGGEQKFVHAYREANRLVDNEPAVWQRGKDRGRFVLGRIRDQLPHDARRQLPTDVIRLVTRTETDRISDPTRAVPSEVAELLNRLAAD